MKQFFISCIIVLVIAEKVNQILYSFGVPTIEGDSTHLSSFSGKRVLVITLPIMRNAASDSLLASIDSLANAHALVLRVVAVPSHEDGFTPAYRDSLSAWYRSYLDSGILITDGLKVRKTSGIHQHALFSWLTHQTQNMHFDLDAAAPGYKYFTNAEGKLVAVLRPQTHLSSTSVTRALQAQ